MVLVLVRLFMRPKPQAQAMQYAGLGNETVAAPPPSQQSWGAVAQPDVRKLEAAGTVVPNIPAGFDVEGFLREAKRNFVRLQQSNDRGDLEALRAVATEEMFDTLKADIAARGSEAQQTDVVTLDASLLEVVTEGNMHWASVRFPVRSARCEFRAQRIRRDLEPAKTRRRIRRLAACRHSAGELNRLESARKGRLDLGAAFSLAQGVIKSGS